MNKIKVRKETEIGKRVERKGSKKNQWLKERKKQRKAQSVRAV